MTYGFQETSVRTVKITKTLIPRSHRPTQLWGKVSDYHTLLHFSIVPIAPLPLQYTPLTMSILQLLLVLLLFSMPTILLLQITSNSHQSNPLYPPHSIQQGKNKESFKISYGSGSVKGIVASDTITLSTIVLPNVVFGEVTRYTHTLLTLPSAIPPTHLLISKPPISYYLHHSCRIVNP